MNSDNAYSVFISEVERRKRNVHELDIRRHVENLANAPVAFGYIQGNLNGGYGANVVQRFPRVRGFDRSDAARAHYAFIPRAPARDGESDEHPGTTKLLTEFNKKEDILFFEQGLIASVASWSHSLRGRSTKYACLAYMYDDLAFYYMANYQSRLNRKLNSSDVLSREETERSEALIARIVASKISKYNSQPLSVPELDKRPRRRKRVLVVDQAYGDASTRYGLADGRVFEDMLLAAIRENPDAEVIVKTHPDSIYEKETRSGYYSGLADFGKVVFFNEAVNPYTLFEYVDKVYVATSGVGLEALMAGKDVICFGAPFYSGWGLTEDRRDVPHRHRNRTLAEVFYYTYIWYTHYHTPDTQGVCSIEDALDYIEANRVDGVGSVNDHEVDPVVSVIVPAHNAEPYIGECLESILAQSLSAIEVLVVDDCSTDGTARVISSFSQKDRRVKPIFLEDNVGQGFARNIAIEKARGDFIWFLDADDWFADDDVLHDVHAVAVRTGADMTRARKAYESVEDANGGVTRRADRTEQFFAQPFVTDNFLALPTLLQTRHFWGFLYRRAMIVDSDIKFVLPQWEERPFLIKALLSARKIADSHREAVVYRVRQDSTARREKTALDVERQLDNFAEVIGQLGQASSEDVRFKRYLCFTVSQCIHYTLYGFVWTTLCRLQNGGQVATLRGRITELFRSSGVSVMDLTGESATLSKSRFDGYVYHLLFALVKAARWDLVTTLLEDRPIDATELYALLLGDDEEMSYAINGFIKYSNVQVHYPSRLRRKGPWPTVVLHIGASKTGSTYIQHVLDYHRAALLRQGIYYPEFGQFWQEDRRHKQAGHSDFLVAARKQDSRLLTRLENAILALQQVLGRELDKVVLSSEAFFLADQPERMVDYFAGHNVKVLAYLRRQDEWANSQYCEFAAGGALGRTSMPIEQWLQDTKTTYLLSYDRVLERWRTRMPANSITVRPFETQQLVNGDLIQDFSQQIGAVGIQDLSKGTELLKNQLPVLARHVNLFRHFNALKFPSQRHYLQFVEDVHQGLTAVGLVGEKVNMLTRGQREELLCRYQAANENVARLYLGRDDGCLFQESDCSAAPDQIDSQELSPAELALFFAAYQRVMAPQPSTSAQFGENFAIIYSNAALPNFGWFGWRRLVYRLAEPKLKRRLGSDGYNNLLRNPAEALVGVSGTGKRFLRYFLVSYVSNYGIREWRLTLVPVLATLIRRLKGDQHASQFKADPIRFVRGLVNPGQRMIGRLVFPSGEVIARESESGSPKS